jgi:hypothetical protein
MVRSIVAIIAGYGALVVATMICVGVLTLAFGLPMGAVTFPKTVPTAYVIANLFASGGCAVLGGFIAARIGFKAPRQSATILAAILLVIGAIYAIGGKSGPQPMWYLIALPIVGAAGAVTGGMLVHTPSG